MVGCPRSAAIRSVRSSCDPNGGRKNGVSPPNVRPQEVAVAGDLLGHLGVAERGDVGVGPGVVAEGDLPGVHQRAQDGGVLLPRPVAPVGEEGEPDVGVRGERGEGRHHLAAGAVVDGQRQAVPRSRELGDDPGGREQRARHLRRPRRPATATRGWARRRAAPRPARVPVTAPRPVAATASPAARVSRNRRRSMPATLGSARRLPGGGGRRRAAAVRSASGGLHRVTRAPHPASRDHYRRSDGGHQPGLLDHACLLPAPRRPRVALGLLPLAEGGPVEHLPRPHLGRVGAGEPA